MVRDTSVELQTKQRLSQGSHHIDEIVLKERIKPDALEPAFIATYGAFVVINFLDTGTTASETAHETFVVRSAALPLYTVVRLAMYFQTFLGIWAP